MRNIYFELTREFNAQGPITALASGQAVVFYRIAIMSKDGDWILKETQLGLLPQVVRIPEEKNADAQ